MRSEGNVEGDISVELLLTKLYHELNIEPEEFDGKESGYVYEKTERLLDFGVERVIWITTQPRKIFVATRTAPWTTQNWDADVPVLDDVVLNLAGLLTEEGIAF